MPETHLDQLDVPARDMAERSLAWMDRCWDEAAGLFRMPDDSTYEYGQPGVPGHLVRETAWYALSLLLRDADFITLHYHARSSRTGAPIHFILQTERP